MNQHISRALRDSLASDIPTFKDMIFVDPSMEPGMVRWHTGGIVGTKGPKPPKAHTARYDEGEDPFQYTKRDDDDWQPDPLRGRGINSVIIDDYPDWTSSKPLTLADLDRAAELIRPRPQIDASSFRHLFETEYPVDEGRHEKQYGWYRKHSRNKWENRP